MLENIIRTLDSIEVRGTENLSRMLGCIQLLRKMQQENTENEKEAEHD